MNELLNPNFINLEEVYKNEFEGMTNETIEFEKLSEVQWDLSSLLLGDLTDREKEFLLSFQQADPKWDLMPIDHLQDLPGVQWKLINIRKMDKKKHTEIRKKLESVLGRG